MRRAQTVVQLSIQARCRDHPKNGRDKDRSESDSCWLDFDTIVKPLTLPVPISARRREKCGKSSQSLDWR